MATVRCYMPDELKVRAEAAEVNFSQLLRRAVLAELASTPPASEPGPAESPADS